MKNALLIFCFLPLMAQTSKPVLPRNEITLTYLANEGFLLQSATASLLIDAFVTQPYTIYPYLSGDTWRRMTTAEAPFEKVQLALVSHRHRDHFQADAAILFLQKHPETVLVSSGDVVSDLSLETGYASVKARIKQLLPGPAETLVWSQGDLRVEVLRITHGGKRWRGLHNLGHVIHMGGMKVLHIGDASTDLSHYEPYREQISHLDIAMVPFWFYSDPEGRQVVRDVFACRYEVAVHIPLQGRQEILDQFAREHAGVIVFKKEMETRTLAHQ